MAADNGITSEISAVAISYLVYYDPSKYTFSDLSCPIFNGAVNTCSKTLMNGSPNIDQTLPPSFAGGPGHKLFVNSNPDDCTNCIKILIYTTVVPANPISTATLDASGNVVGNDLVMTMQFALVQGLTNDAVNISLIDASDKDGNFLTLKVVSERIITGQICPPGNTCVLP
jgi:hypothetical protein